MPFRAQGRRNAHALGPGHRCQDSDVRPHRTSDFGCLVAGRQAGLSSSIPKPEVLDKSLDHFVLPPTAVRLWDTTSGKLVRTLVQTTHSTFGPVAFSPDGKLAAAGGGGWSVAWNQVDGWDVKLWDATTGRAKQSLAAVDTAGVTCIAISPDNKVIASGHCRGVRVWERATGKLLWSYPTPRWAVHSIAFSPDGRSILAAGNETDFLVALPDHGAEGGLALLDAATGKEDPKLVWAKHWIRSVAFSPDGKWVLGATGQGLTVWRGGRGENASR